MAKIYLTFHLIHLYGFAKNSFLFNSSFFLISITCGLSMCIQLCVKVSDSTRWLQNEQGLYLLRAIPHCSQMNYININTSLAHADSYYISAAYIIPFTHALRNTQQICIKLHLRNFLTILQTLHPPNFPTPALLKLIKE